MPLGACLATDRLKFATPIPGVETHRGPRPLGELTGQAVTTKSARASSRESSNTSPDVSGEHYAFRHALLAEVAYDELLPFERVRAHAAFAEALELEPRYAGGNAATVAAEIAHHHVQAGNEARAFAASVRAGLEAQRIRAMAEAHQQYERALTLWDRVNVAGWRPTPSRMQGDDDQVVRRWRRRRAGLGSHRPRAARPRRAVDGKRRRRAASSGQSERRGDLAAAASEGDHHDRDATSRSGWRT